MVDRYPTDGVPFGRRGRGRPRTKPEGIAFKEGVIHDCLACLRRLHKFHPVHISNGEPPMLQRQYQMDPSGWSFEACLRVRPHDDLDHALAVGCRYADGGKEVARSVKKQQGQTAGVGPARGPAIPAAGVADRDPITDDIEFDADVGGAISAPGGGGLSPPQASGELSRRRNKRRGHPHPIPPNLQDLVDLTEDEEEDNDGFTDRFSPVIAREQRAARAREIFG